jgi:hypothetical protein
MCMPEYLYGLILIESGGQSVKRRNPFNRSRVAEERGNFDPRREKKSQPASPGAGCLAPAGA